MYQHLRRPTAMPYGTTLHIFKKGIKPVWEDPSLSKGSRFQVKSEKKTTSKYWEDLVLAMIGEQLGTKSDMIAGLVLNLKTQFDKVAIWFTDCDDQEEINKIKEDIIAILQIEEKDLEYDVFQEKRGKEAKPFFNKRGGKFMGRGGGRGGRGGRGGADEGGFERKPLPPGEGNNFFRKDQAKGTDKKEDKDQ